MNEISTQELVALRESDRKFVLLDCRGVDYFNWEHIPGAQNIRWKYIAEKTQHSIPDKNTLIVTYCDGFTCKASVRCYENLLKAGYTNLLEYSGGIADWVAHGNATESHNSYKIASNVYRFPEQTFYGSQVGSYLVEEEDFILLVDGPMQLTEEHEDFIEHFAKPIKVFMTHESTAGETKKLQERYNAEIYLHPADKHGRWLTLKPNAWLEDGFKFSNHLQVIHTPGHSAGSCALYDSQNNIMFTGDHISGDAQGGIDNFLQDAHSDDPKESMRSAHKLLQYDFDTILPFHYNMILHDGKRLLQEFVEGHTS